MTLTLRRGSCSDSTPVLFQSVQSMRPSPFPDLSGDKSATMGSPMIDGAVVQGGRSYTPSQLLKWDVLFVQGEEVVLNLNVVSSSERGTSFASYELTYDDQSIKFELTYDDQSAKFELTYDDQSYASLRVGHSHGTTRDLTK